MLRNRATPNGSPGYNRSRSPRTADAPLAFSLHPESSSRHRRRKLLIAKGVSRGVPKNVRQERAQPLPTEPRIRSLLTRRPANESSISSPKKALDLGIGRMYGSHRIGVAGERVRRWQELGGGSRTSQSRVGGQGCPGWQCWLATQPPPPSGLPARKLGVPAPKARGAVFAQEPFLDQFQLRDHLGTKRSD